MKDTILKICLGVLALGLFVLVSGFSLPTPYTQVNTALDLSSSLATQGVVVRRGSTICLDGKAAGGTATTTDCLLDDGTGLATILNTGFLESPANVPFTITSIVPAATVSGGSMGFIGAAGGVATAGSVGGNGSLISVKSGAGGAGSSAQVGGNAGLVQIATGAPGATGGAGAGSDGAMILDINPGSSAAANGNMYMCGAGVASTDCVALNLGTSTTTIPVKIAGGSGAFVGSCTMSSATTCTATVPSGAKCSAVTTTGGQTLKSVAVASTTVTVTATASGSDTWNIICL